MPNVSVYIILQLWSEELLKESAQWWISTAYVLVQNKKKNMIHCVDNVKGHATNFIQEIHWLIC